MAELFFYSRTLPATPIWWQDHVRTTETDVSAPPPAPAPPSSGVFSQTTHIPYPPSPWYEWDLDYSVYQAVAVEATSAVAVLYDGEADDFFEAFELGAGWISTQNYEPLVSGPMRKVDMAGEWAVAAIDARNNFIYYADMAVFKNTAGTWALAFTFTSEDLALANRRTTGLAISPNAEYAMLGAEGISGEPGRVLVYKRTGTTWAHFQTIAPPGGEGEDPKFGWSVAMGVGYAVISHPGYAWSGTNMGRAYVYEHFSGGGEYFTPSYFLTRPTEVSEAWFGDSVAISGDGERAIVSDRTSKVYSFTQGAEVYSYEDTLVVSAQSYSRTQVALSSDALTIVTASYEVPGGQQPMLIFEYSEPGGWAQTQSILPVPAVEGTDQIPSVIRYRGGNIVIAWEAEWA